MNYLIPVNSVKIKNKKIDIDETKSILDNILTQQIIISKLSSITYQDTEQMDDYERRKINPNEKRRR